MEEQRNNPVEASQQLRVIRRDGGRFGGAVGAFAVLSLIVLICLALVGPGWRSPPALIAGLVLILPYLFLGMSGLGFVLWSAMPDRQSLALVTLAPLIYALITWGPTWSASGQELTEGSAIRLMSYNVRRLWGNPAKEAPSAACVGAVLEEVDPDVITFLEVSQENIDELSERFGLSCHQATYQESAATDVGGLAVCTRGDRWALASAKATRYRDDMDWYYVFSEIESGGRLVNVLAVHLYPYRFSAGAFRSGPDILDLGRNSVEVVKGQGAQSAALLERVARFEDPTILAGDFNSTRDFALHTSLREHLTDVWERGGFGFGATVDLLGWLPLRIDYVYSTKELAVVDSSVKQVDCSDHRPVVANLVLRE
jgi:endonuclease/exonuclease/phosphatase (EEP) superfamily protein YafD